MEKIINLINSAVETRISLILFLSFIAGITNFFWKYSKGEKQSTVIFFVNTWIACFVGYATSIIVPDSMGETELFIVMMCAFVSRDLLGIIENKFPEILKNKIKQFENDNNK